MRGSKVKQIRTYIMEHPEEVLLLIRNDVGDKTQNMGPEQVLQHAKRLYKQGKLKV